MKKYIIILLAIFIVLFTNNVNAAENENIDPIQIENVFNWIDMNSSEMTENGARGVRAYNANDPYANGIGIKQQFNVQEGNTVSLTFQIPMYNHTDRTLLDGHVDVSVPYDIYVTNVDTGFTSIFRLWVDNSKNKGQEASWIQYCESKTSGWETYSGGYISGVATNGSSFTLSFDKENYLSAYCNWVDSENQMVPFHELGEIGNKKDAYLSFMEENYGNATCIEFWFAHQQLKPGTYNEVILQEVNGQSMKLDDGLMVDNTAPYVPSINAKNDAVYTKNTEYTLRIEKYLNDPATKSDFFVHPIMDFASAADDLVEGAKVYIKHSSDSSFKQVGVVDVSSSMIKQISFDKVGSYEMYLEVTDRAGNKGQSPIYQINVIKGYDIVLNGEVPSECYVGSVITIPSAIASDENGVEKEVKITVEDPIGNVIEVVDYKFTPTSQGVYYVIYTSSYVDTEGKTQRAEKVEREIIVIANPNSSNGENNNNENNNQQNDGNNGCSGAILTSCLGVLALGCSILVIKRKKDIF